MRTYGQYCALARSLDVLGDRWTLLIVRELFARDSRYSDLRDGLPGIATNLLADRLRQLQEDGLVEAYDAAPPVRATVYRLTGRGRELGPVLRSLVAWGMPLLGDERGNDEFRPQWLMLVLRTLYDDVSPAGIAPLVVVIHTEHEPVTVEVGDRTVDVVVGAPSSAEVVEVEGDPHDVYMLLAGEEEDGLAKKVNVTGPADAVKRLHVLAERVAESRRESPVVEGV